VAPKRSAGLLLYRRADHGLEVLLGHMGGPLWARRDERAWSIPKGEFLPPEAALDAARREFVEELGSAPPPGDPAELGDVTQSGGKIVTAWAIQGDFDVTSVHSNTFEMEWPRGSGRMQSFPELDRAQWFAVDAARTKLVAAQADFLDRLVSLVGLG
jgi:predicted NUDIX family NTP pyrophosphohydrolase